jgi:hypothetical protein
MDCRAKIHIIGLSLMPILMLASAESRSADAQAKLDAYYTATLLGLPIGHISWAVDLKENRFSSVATGSISGVLRLFLDAQGSVAAEGRLSSGKPVPSKFQLKLLAGKWSVKKSLERVERRLAKWNGTIPAFGRPTGLIVNYAPDFAVRFDLRGSSEEIFGEAYRIGQTHLSLRGRSIPAGGLPRVVHAQDLNDCEQSPHNPRLSSSPSMTRFSVAPLMPNEGTEKSPLPKAQHRLHRAISD